MHPVYQAFQLTDPFVYPILNGAVQLHIPIYIPAGTPIMNMPLQLKYLATEFIEGVFIQGHFSSTDYWIDAVPSVGDCPNVYVDTAYNMVSSIENAVRYAGPERVIFFNGLPICLQKLNWRNFNGLIFPRRIKVAYCPAICKDFERELLE